MLKIQPNLQNLIQNCVSEIINHDFGSTASTPSLSLLLSFSHLSSLACASNFARAKIILRSPFDLRALAAAANARGQMCIKTNEVQLHR